MNKREIRFAASLYQAALAQNPRRSTKAAPLKASPKRASKLPPRPVAKPVTKAAAKPARKRLSIAAQFRTARLRFVIPAGLAVIALLIVLSTQFHTTAHQTKALLPAPAAHKDIIKPVPLPPKAAVHTETTLKPIGDKSTCPHGTQLTVVAHQDDDILFMNPAIQQSITNGWCIRTVYVTAGDDGKGADYWQQREQGPEAAYATMFGADNQWGNQTALISGHQVTSYSLDGNPKVSLVFMRLPDGNVDGRGFDGTNNQSLRSLRSGAIVSITSLDGASTYSRVDLINTLRTLIDLDKPKVINTQAFSANLARGDHSDHQAVGYFTSVAAAAVSKSVTIHRFIGYQAGDMVPNLSDDQVASKLNIFSAYDSYDTMVCNDNLGCFNSFTYLRYLSRQYEQINPGL